MLAIMSVVSGDDGYEVDAVFYMSADMIYQLQRNGTVLVMDTTFKDAVWLFLHEPVH
jgi:hypothetical protein